MCFKHFSLAHLLAERSKIKQKKKKKNEEQTLMVTK